MPTSTAAITGTAKNRANAIRVTRAVIRYPRALCLAQQHSLLPRARYTLTKAIITSPRSTTLPSIPKVRAGTSVNSSALKARYAAIPATTAITTANRPEFIQMLEDVLSQLFEQPLSYIN